MEVPWELLSFAWAILVVVVASIFLFGIRFGIFNTLLVLLFLVPTGAYYYVREHHPDQVNLARALLAATGVGVGIMLWGLFRLGRAGTPEWEDLLRSPPMDSQVARATLVGKGWLYRRIRLGEPYRCDIQYRLSWNRNPLTLAVFGEELVLVNDRLVYHRLARHWFGLEYPFELPTPRGKVPARLRLRFHWLSLRIYAVQLEVDGQVVYEENPEYWQRVRPPGTSPDPEQ